MDFEIHSNETLGNLAAQIADRIPALARATGLRLAVNRTYVALDHPLADGDEIAVIPPVSGGSCSTGAAIIRESIDVDKYIRHLGSHRAGAIASFVGTVRQESRERIALRALDYHAYEEMAIEQMTRIRERAVEKFGLLDAVVVHRLGQISLGEASILVCVTSPHRAEAFDAVRWIVDAVKTDVPIWKKDIWADKSSNWTATQGE